MLTPQGGGDAILDGARMKVENKYTYEIFIDNAFHYSERRTLTPLPRGTTNGHEVKVA